MSWSTPKPMRRTSTLKRSEMRRTEWIKKKRTNDLARDKAKDYRLKAKPGSAAEKRFKREVRERDGYKCRWPECDYESAHIHVHHIHTRKQRPDLRDDPDNCACLCFKHHDQLHHTVEGRRRGRELNLLGTETYEKAKKEAA